jgi:beta-1,4-mannosyltransferase
MMAALETMLGAVRLLMRPRPSPGPRSRPRTLRLAAYPATNWNPYLRLFYEALRPYGVELVGAPTFEDRWLREGAHDVDVLHLHWAYPWRVPEASVRSVAGFWKYLRFARALGKRVFWTFHDVEQPEGVNALDRWGCRALAHEADLLICHDRWAARELARRYGAARGKIVVMEHGNYDGVFPPPGSRTDTLRRLDLDPGRPTLLCFGGIRTYKGFSLAIDAARLLGPAVQLVVAGRPDDAECAADLARRAQGLENVRLIRRPLADQEIADLAHAADCILLPYEKITGSGAIHAAFTMRRGVVASDLPYFRHVLGPDRAAGVLFDLRRGAEGLAQAVPAFLASAPARHAAARRLADARAWPAVIEPVARRIDAQFGGSRMAAGAAGETSRPPGRPLGLGTRASTPCA